MSEAVMLNWILFLPMLGIGLLLLTPKPREDLMRGISFAVMTLQFLLALYLYAWLVLAGIFACLAWSWGHV